MARVIGLTGGIASGKSTVSTYLKNAGYSLIDADAVVHELQEKGKVLYNALVAHFGSDILDQEGNLNRPKLAEMIFSNPEKRADSALLQDTIIRKELKKRLVAVSKDSDLIFMDLPLLYELSYEEWFDDIWLVYVDEEIQLERLKKRNGYSKKEAQQRISSQLSLMEKAKQADVVLVNQGSLDDLYAQIKVELERLEK